MGQMTHWIAKGVARLPENLDVVPIQTRVDSAPACPVISQEVILLRAYEEAMVELRHDLMGHVYAQSHEFFETLVIDVLLAMGYAGRRRDLAHRIGKSHDGGVDGLIEQDELGLDVIYLQAKRLKPGTTVAVSDVRDFVGSLEAKRAVKGVFVTTANFTPSAQQFIDVVSKRVVLINGSKLAELMIRHNIGVVAKQSYQFKSIDRNYFIAASKRL